MTRITVEPGPPLEPGSERPLESATVEVVASYDLAESLRLRPGALEAIAEAAAVREVVSRLPDSRRDPC